MTVYTRRGLIWFLRTAASSYASLPNALATATGKIQDLLLLKALTEAAHGRGRNILPKYATQAIILTAQEYPSYKTADLQYCATSLHAQNQQKMNVKNPRYISGCQMKRVQNGTMKRYIPSAE